jgi:hypothetical protein
VFAPVAEERSLLREVELLASIPLDPAFATINGIPSHFHDLASVVEERLTWAGPTTASAALTETTSFAQIRKGASSTMALLL